MSSIDLDAKISLTKVDVVKRQLETAAAMLFEERDPVSIHTLVGAAHRVIHDISEHRGIGGAFMVDGKRIEEWGFSPKEFKNAVRYAETFFKHAKEDPEGVFDFSPRETEFIFMSAIECYHRFTGDYSKLLSTCMAWFRFQHPATLSESFRDRFPEMIGRIGKMSPMNFFHEFGEFDFVRLIYGK